MPRSLIGGEQVRADDFVPPGEHSHELTHFFIALVDVPTYAGLSNTPNTYEAGKYLITTGSDFELVTISDIVGLVGSQGEAGA